MPRKTLAYTMTADEYSKALDRLGLTQDSAAGFLGTSLRTSHGYANGKRIRLDTAKLLRTMLRLKLDPHDIK